MQQGSTFFGLLKGEIQEIFHVKQNIMMGHFNSRPCHKCTSKHWEEMEADDSPHKLQIIDILGSPACWKINWMLLWDSQTVKTI